MTQHKFLFVKRQCGAVSATLCGQLHVRQENLVLRDGKHWKQTFTAIVFVTRTKSSYCNWTAKWIIFAFIITEICIFDLLTTPSKAYGCTQAKNVSLVTHGLLFYFIHDTFQSISLRSNQSLSSFCWSMSTIYIYIFVTILNVSFCHALQRFIVLLYAKVLLHFKVPQLHSHSALFSLWSAPPGRYAHTLSPASNNITCHFFDNSLTRILGSRLCQLT